MSRFDREEYERAGVFAETVRNHEPLLPVLLILILMRGGRSDVKSERTPHTPAASTVASHPAEPVGGGG
jgi:hypothetical protein